MTDEPGADEASDVDDLAVAWLNGLAVLSRVDCLRRLAGASLGRVGFKLGEQLSVLPVNFVVEDARIVFRTAPGSKLSAALMGTRVAFEVDAVDPTGMHGWSVLVNGYASEIRDQAGIEQAGRLDLSPWAPGSRRYFVAVRIDQISGRSFGPPGAMTP